MSRLEELLKQARKQQNAAISALNQVRNDTLGRIKFTMWDRQRLNKQYTEFKNSMDEVDKICARIHQFQTAPASTFLRPEHFKVKHEVPGTLPGELLAWSDIREVDGNYSLRDQRIRGKFILEGKTRENDVKFISRLLDKSERPAGVPKCLGYRQPCYNDPTPPHQPIFELVFEAPASVHQSLTALITNEPIPAFDARIQLVKQIAKAVLHVHNNFDLVHKAIRSRAILVANWSGRITNLTQGQIPMVYLLDWTYVRKTSDATSMSGGDAAWPRMIYQHPDRQGSPGHYPETEYEAKHDVYSLGVVVLEMLLWTPFISQTTSSSGEIVPRIGDIFEQRALQLGEANGGLPSRFAGNSAKLASRPHATKNVWISLAAGDLAQLNQEASDIVSKCLDGRFTSAAEVIQALELIR